MRACKLSAVVGRRRIGDVGLVVLEPAFNNAFFWGNLSRCQGYIAPVGHDASPIVLKNLLGFYRFGVDQQTGSVAVEPMHHVCSAFLPRFPEIVVENRLDAELSLRGSHGKNSYILFYHNDLRIFVYNLDKLALKLRARLVF